MWSKGCSYGLLAALYLAGRDRADFVPIRQISDDLGLSCSFLTKVLQRLTRRHLLVSLRGPNGGVRLARSADRICLRDIIEAIDGPRVFESCVLGLAGYDARRPCPLHQHWQPVHRTFLEPLAASTLASLTCPSSPASCGPVHRNSPDRCSSF